jgi:hypothetical protein
MVVRRMRKRASRRETSWPIILKRNKWRKIPIDLSYLTPEVSYPILHLRREADSRYTFRSQNGDESRFARPHYWCTAPVSIIELLPGISL